MAEPAVTTLSPYILVLPIKDSSEGLELPDEAKKNKNRAKVIAISDKDSQELALIPGQTVYIADYVNHPLELNNNKYFFVKVEDVMGVNRG